MTPSLGARKLIMSAYLYYRRHSPILSDGKYDRLSMLVAGCWGDLDDHLRWQLGSTLEIVSTGSHIKVTRAAERGAIMWHTNIKGCGPHGFDIPDTDWRHDSERDLYWASAEP